MNIVQKEEKKEKLTLTHSEFVLKAKINAA